MTTEIKELVKRLRIFKHRDANAAADALEAMAGEVERLKSQRDEYLQFWKNNAEACEAAEAERDRLKAALEKFIAEANTAPKRIIGNGIGGQTMEATLKASGRLISEWQIERLRNSMELHVEGCREEL